MKVAPGESSTVTVPPWAAMTSRTIASPKPVPPLSRARVVVDVCEPFEDPLVGVRGNARPVVTHHEPDRGRRLLERDLDRGVRVRRGIVEQVPDHTHELVGVDLVLRARNLRGVHLEGRVRCGAGGTRRGRSRPGRWPGDGRRLASTRRRPRWSGGLRRVAGGGPCRPEAHAWSPVGSHRAIVRARVRARHACR